MSAIAAPASSSSSLAAATSCSSSATDPDVFAWVTVTNLSVHWTRGQPFREPAATIRPILVVGISGQRYVSGWDLAVQVADQTITMADWVAAARLD